MAKKENATEAQKLDFTHVLPISLIEMNDGQLEGLPKNPRYIKDERFAKLKLSLETSPEFLEANPLKVYPLENGHFIIIGGNMRFLAGREVGIKEFPCYIFKKETPIAKLKEFLIKDNIAFGNTDWDALANDDWEVSDLEDWGMDCSFLAGDDGTDIDGLFEEANKQQEKEKVTKITISVPECLNEQLGEIMEAVKEAVAAYDGIEVK
ncbi:MAG: hypothetical protein IJ640_00530 [Prevotella sp.]|nr:hypothetical protein [Prevotella sp.]